MKFLHYFKAMLLSHLLTSIGFSAAGAEMFNQEYHEKAIERAMEVARLPLLQEFNTKDNFTGDNTIQLGDEGAIIIAGSASPHLITVRMIGQDIGDAGAIALAGNLSIVNLDLSENHIGDAGAIALAGKANLASLDLSNNNIGDAGADALRNSAIANLKF